MRIELHIESLVLDGVEIARGQERRLQTAVVEELTRLLGATGSAEHLVARGDAELLRATPLRLDARVDASTLGTQMASSIGSALRVRS